MATWQELSLDNLRSAKLLAGAGHLRSSINRSYYAAYCAVTAELVARGLSFTHGWNNPAHNQLPDLVAHNLTLPEGVRRRLRKILRVMRSAREDADYRPGITVDRVLTLNCLRDAITVLRSLGVNDDGTE